MCPWVPDVRRVRAWHLHCLIVATGCGRMGFATVDPPGDAAPPTCWSSWTQGSPKFAGPPVAVSEINTTAREKNPFLTADRTTLYFASDRKGSTGGNDFWRAVRASPDAPFGPPERLADLSSTADDGRVELSPDGLTGVLSSLRSPSSGGYDLWLATRSTPSSAFTVTAMQGSINSTKDDKDPHFSSDGARLYFSVESQRLVVDPCSGTSFGPPVDLPGLGAVPGGGDPNPSPDELAIVFSKQPASSSIDLYLATRASTADAFGRVVALGEFLADLRTDAAEQDAFLSGDGCELWFASDRSGNFDIYVARIAP